MLTTDIRVHDIQLTYTRDPLYPEMKIKYFFKYSACSPGPFARIRAKLKHFYSILVPNFAIFVQIRGLDRIIDQKNKDKARSPV